MRSKPVTSAIILGLALSFVWRASAQKFVRSELSTTFSNPWEIIYAPDGFLYVNDSGARVSRVEPATGRRRVLWMAPDHYPGHPSETHTRCHKPRIGAGTLGMALHPDFLNPLFSYIYIAYSYNEGSDTAPMTRFKIVRLSYSREEAKIVTESDLVTGLSSGYDHFGGRLMVFPQNGLNYIFFSVGDHGISETNDPDCYAPQSDNPNNFAQDPDRDNGKIHRFHLDGSVPGDNPIAGNSFYTRGHRNPQGLMYNPVKGIIYNTEHGDRTDDEINVLLKGMNYGWKWVRGYHGDDNFPGEATFLANYTPHPNVPGDKLIPPLYSWCTGPQPSDPQYLNWCTVAPSGGEYYGNSAIPEWNNSLLVTTLKNGASTDQEVYRFKLNPDGLSLAPSTPTRPNPARFFGEDQALNGRLRDIAISPDGRRIYLINNGGKVRDHITVYTYEQELLLFPNPAHDILNVRTADFIASTSVCDITGQVLITSQGLTTEIDIRDLPAGIYIAKLKNGSGEILASTFIKF